MHDQRTLSRDEWLPARRRGLSRGRELTRSRHQSNPDRARNAAGPAFDLVRHDPDGEDRKEPLEH